MGNALVMRRGEWPMANGERRCIPFAIRQLLFICVLLLPTLLRAQEVIVTLNIIPPYSAYVYDYADLTGQAVITLTNTTTEVKQVRLEGSLTNSTAGLFIRTEPGHQGPSPITLPPGGSVVLSTQPGVMDFLAPQFVTTNADQSVQQAIVQTGQLPEYKRQNEPDRSCKTNGTDQKGTSTPSGSQG